MCPHDAIFIFFYLLATLGLAFLFLAICFQSSIYSFLYLYIRKQYSVTLVICLVTLWTYLYYASNLEFVRRKVLMLMKNVTMVIVEIQKPSCYIPQC
jgi:hypothetical protein